MPAMLPAWNCSLTEVWCRSDYFESAGSCRSRKRECSGIEVREKHHAFLLIGIGARDEGYAILRRTGVVGKVGHIGRDIDEVARVNHDMVLELFPIPHAGHAAQGIDCSFVSGVLMGLSSRPWRDGHDL